jgi:DNA-binding transcriptional LysR family regulator
MQEYREPPGLEQLEAFTAVAQSGSFTVAARKLNRDASIISRRVSQLEEQLGVRLLSRTTRRVTLTEAGKLYHVRVQVILDELAQANLEASDIATSPQGILRVSLPVTFGRQWIAPLFPAFLKQHPKIRIDAHFSDRRVDVVADSFDIAIRVGVLSDSSLTARKVASFRYVIAAAPSYLTKRGAPRTPEDLSKHDCLGFSGHAAWPDWPLMKDGKRRTVHPVGPLVADNSEAVLMAAIDGLGITYAADWLAGPAIRAGKLVEILPGWGGQGNDGIYAVLPPGHLVPTKTRLFVEEISKVIKAGCGTDKRKQRP